MQRITMTLFVIALAVPAFAQDIPVTGVEDATLEDLAGTPTLVTIVIKDRNAEDPNLQITELGPDYLSVLNPDTGERHAYLYEDVKEIRVQGGKLEAKPFQMDAERGLTQTQQQLLNRAIRQATEVFQQVNQNQPVKMDAAMIIASQGDENGLKYLQSLSQQSDIEIALGAYYRLYVAGQNEIPPNLLERALASGNRQLRATAAQVAGLYREPTAEPYLLRLVRDRSADISGPAAVALARMGTREAEPILLDMLTGLNEDKAKAAALALSILGGDSVIRSLHQMLDEESGLARYRIIEILFKLGDEKGQELMKEEALEIPTLRFEAALNLAPEGNIDAMEILRERLADRYDLQMNIIELRAKAAGALIEGGDRSRVSELQELLRLDFPELREPAAGNWIKGIAAIVSKVVIDINVRALMDVMQPVLVSKYPEARLSAASSIVSLGDPAFRKRMLEHLHSG
ncbi:MAG: HEAT repeat domain-containing protein [Candidatus Hydrogenedentota bacterium]